MSKVIPGQFYNNELLKEHFCLKNEGGTITMVALDQDPVGVPIAFTYEQNEAYSYQYNPIIDPKTLARLRQRVLGMGLVPGA